MAHVNLNTYLGLTESDHLDLYNFESPTSFCNNDMKQYKQLTI